MIRYTLSALALKAFSLNGATKRIYRNMGNALGGKKRENVNLDNYTQRGNLLVALYRHYDGLQPGDHALELGTGWMHWYAVYVRLFFTIRVTALDIWDNRQFGAFKACFARLRERFNKTEGIPETATAILDGIVAANDFEAAYEVLHFEHVIVPDGSLRQFPDSSFDSIFSMHVLEHVPRDLVPALAKDMFRTLKPGRVTIHQIGIDDHLSHYDRAASPKQYIAYSDRVWSMLFENEVQYFNRLQMSDWLKVFENVGFILLEKKVEGADLTGLSVSRSFEHYQKEDLACTTLTLAFRRPGS